MASSILNSDDGVISGTSGLKSTGGDDAVLLIQTNGTTAQTVDSGQRTKFPTTIGVGDATPSASGSGISFPATQSASSDANTLDDYEEGTWSPLYTFSTSGAASTVSNGRYIKVGSCVWVQGYLYINSSTAVTGDATIANLPFTSSSVSQRRQGLAIGSAIRFTSDMPNFRLYIANNSSVITLLKNATNSVTETVLTNADFNVQAEYNIFNFQGTYSV
jgi:hypothetical protein